MKWIRLGALSALLLSVTVVLMLVLMVKYVPRLEDAWQQSRTPITPAKQALLRSSHLYQRFFVVLLPGSLGLLALSATGYVLAVRKDRAERATRP